MNRILSPRSTCLIIAAFLVLACIAIAPAAATPPSAVVPVYDATAKQLSVTITHPVPNPDAHYIRNVMVKLNDQVVVNTDYKSQPSGDTFTYTYTVPAKNGDTLRITATCVTGPSKEVVLDIAAPTQAAATSAPSAPSAPAPAPTTQKSPVGLLPFIGLAAFLLMRKE